MGAPSLAMWAVVFSVLLILGWYLSYTAARLDRLHHKITAARTALDVQLLRRGAAAVEAARHLDPASALMLTDAAVGAITVAEQDADALDGRDPLEVPPMMESCENDLSRALHLAFAESPNDPMGEQGGEGIASGPVVDPFAEADFDALHLSCNRVQLARRLYNDAVTQVVRVRHKRVVRWARLAGRAPMPQMIEFDDSVPPGLSR